MKSILMKFSVQTEQEVQLIDITEIVKDLVANSGVTSGMAVISTMHTTTAITVNEGLPDLEDDLQDLLEKLVPRDGIYQHARFLHTDGQMAVNAPSHLKGALLGFQCIFGIEDRKLVKGLRHTIYLVELDGPQHRNLTLQILGD